MSEIQGVRLHVNNAADVAFSGRLLGEYSTQNAGGTKDRWTELRLWETEAGAWIVESVGKSTAGREIDLRDVKTIPRDPERTENRDDRVAVMEAFGWSIVAKAFARTMGWDVVRRVP